MKKHSRADKLVTDKPRSYGAAMKDLGVSDRQETRRRLNNLVGNSRHQFKANRAATLAEGRGLCKV